MRAILQKRALRFVLLANVVSMLGSGMNSAAVAWHILQATHSEMALGTFAVLQTLPAMLMLPFTGVIIDREDRRRLVMMLDAARAIIILVVAVLAYRGAVKVWQLYLMNTLVAAGFWMFWPTITALIQELTPEGRVRGRQHVPAGGNPGRLADGRRDRRIRLQPHRPGRRSGDRRHAPTWCRFSATSPCARANTWCRGRGMKSPTSLPPKQAERRFCSRNEGGHSISSRASGVMLLGLSWALFLGAMMTGVVVTPPLSDKVFHAGAMGYGWLNGGWGIGAFLSALYAPWMIARWGRVRSIAISMGVLAIA